MKKILENYKKQIQDIKKLDFSEAKNILRKSMNESDLVKKEIIDNVFKGTMHYVLEYIEKFNYDLFSSSSYDLNDIINSAYEIWYTNISNYLILNYNQIDRLLDKAFTRDLIIKVIPVNSERRYNLLNGNLDVLDMMVRIYFDIRKEENEIDYQKMLKYMEKEMLLKANYLEYEEAIEFRDALNKFKTNKKYCELMIPVLEKSYQMLSKNDKKEVCFDKKIIVQLNKLIINLGLTDRISLDYIKTDESEEIIEKMDLENLMDLVFYTDILSEKEKEIIKFNYDIDNSKTYDLTKEEIKLIEINALKKIKNIYLDEKNAKIYVK